MSRRARPTGCVFCDPDPCQCSQKIVKPARIPRPLTVAEVEDAVIPAGPLRASALDAMRKAAARDDLARRKALLDPRPPGRRMNEIDALTLQALRNLSVHFTLDGPDLEPYRDALAQEATVEERALAWKYRRRLA